MTSTARTIAEQAHALTKRIKNLCQDDCLDCLAEREATIEAALTEARAEAEAERDNWKRRALDAEGRIANATA